MACYLRLTPVMPIKIIYLDDRKGGVFACTGRLKGSEFIAANIELFDRDFATDPLWYVLVDADHATAVDVTNEDVRAIATLDRQLSGKAPNLVVAIYAQESLMFGLSRMWKAYVGESPWVIDVFRDRTDAVAWLKKEVATRTGTVIALG